jgi:hypothetical protein
LAPSTRDRISVDLRGLKPALIERAQATGLRPSDLVREALIASLHGEEDKAPASSVRALPGIPKPHVRLSLRMTAQQGKATFDAARAAGLPPGAFVAGLVAGVPILVNGSSRAQHIAALTATQSELATLSRNLHHLAALLRQGAWRAADEYRPMLQTLAHDVHTHLDTATRALSELQPRQSPCGPASRTTGAKR